MLQPLWQAKWVAQVLSGRAKLPDEAIMIKEMEAFYDLRASHGVPKRYMHCQVRAFARHHSISCHPSMAFCDEHSR